MAHLMGAAMELQKVTIVSRGEALGYAFNLPEEDRYLHTKEELIDRMVVALAGRAAEEVVFGRVTNGAANDLEKVTEIARAMVFEWGMADAVSSRTMRADNYSLSEETKRLRDVEQARSPIGVHRGGPAAAQASAPLDRLAQALLERETLIRDEGSCSSSASSPSRARRSPSASRASSRRSWPAKPRRLKRRTVRSLACNSRAGNPPLGVAVADLDEAVVDVRAALRRPSSSIASASRTRASRRRRSASARAGSSCSRRSGDTPVGKFLAKRGPGMHHVAYEVDDVPPRSRISSARGAELIDGEPRRGHVRAPGRVRPAGIRPRRSLGGGGAWLSERVRIEIGFDGGQMMAARQPESVDAARAGARPRTARAVTLDVEDGPLPRGRCRGSST